MSLSQAAKVSGSFRNRLVSLAVVCTAYILCFFLLESPSLPDYDSYGKIFEQPDSYQSWNFLFSSIFGLAILVMKYDVVRHIFLVIGTLLCAFLVSRHRHSLPSFIVLLPIVVIFLLEFFQIRLRAGLSISLFYAAFFIGVRSLRFLISIPLMALSFAVHPATGFTLLLCSGLILKGIRSIKLRFLCLLIGWMIFLVLIDFVSSDRGEHLFSDINLVRLLTMCLFPMLGLLFLRNFKLGYLARPEFSGIGSVFFCGFAVSTLYIFGFFSTSGEAIVRILSLVTGVSLLVSVLTTNYSKLTKNFALSILFLNALFFINTVYL